MTQPIEQRQVIVIGAGPGGYAAAFEAADLGLDVTLVDPAADPGGVCLYHGCIPSKALLHVAKVIEDASEASSFGVSFDKPEIDRERVREWKNQVVRKLTGGLGQLADQRDVEYVRGKATFEDHRTVRIERAQSDAGDQPTRIRFEHAIIATGSQPSALPGLPFDSKRIWSSQDALELDEIPERLLVVGGGYIGLEMATVYAALGSEVTIVEATPNLLPGVDRDLVEPLAKRLAKKVSDIQLETMVADATEVDDGIEVVLGEGEKQHFNRVLVAVGRTPNSVGLGLQHTRVEVGPDGFIEVDERRKTTEPHIFAIGDVTSQPMLAHKAHHEGRVAAEVIAGRRSAFDARAIPAVVFTDPAVAWCGLTESEAHESGIDVEVGRFPWAASGRAATMGRPEGMTKVIVEPSSKRVLGVGIVGAQAGELIAEAALAIEMSARSDDLALTIHPHPTLSETIMEAAEAIDGEATHIFRGGG
jgi:dihydrolipoamide dehydrogenase